MQHEETVTQKNAENVLRLINPKKNPHGVCWVLAPRTFKPRFVFSDSTPFRICFALLATALRVTT